jgi:hypothetical protein
MIFVISRGIETNYQAVYECYGVIRIDAVMLLRIISI